MAESQPARDPRSRPNRHALVARSLRDQCAIEGDHRGGSKIAGSELFDEIAELIFIRWRNQWLAGNPRLSSDRDMIMARSPRDHGVLAAKSRPRSRRDQGHDSQNQSHVQSAPTTASIGHDLWAKFPFKSMYFSSYFLNF